MKPRIFLPEPIAAAGLNLLGKECDCIGPWLEQSSSTSFDALAALAEADGVLVRLFKMQSKEITLAPRLKVIAKHGVGVDNIDVAAASARRIPVVYTPTANANAVAEHTMALMFALARHIHTAHAATMAGRFQDRLGLEGVELAGKTLGIIGIGRIGARVAHIAHFGLGMDVSVYDPFVSTSGYDGPARFVNSVEELLSVADFLTLHVPLTPETRCLINAERLRLLKPTCRIINTSRGGVIDEDALAAALCQGQIAGAALDVFENEPLPANHPFLSAPNMLLTPHISSSTKESLARMAVDAALGILDVLNGRSPAHVVNPRV
jgi:D-3-phosphoglycerate dehydrogenase / 2-oxoglutarate reductase